MLFSRTAVVLFSLSPETEAKRKPLFKGHSTQVNVEIYRRLHDHMELVCAESELPYFHFGDDLQRGEDFGERFCNAIEDAFDLGYERLVLIGNDAPDIDAMTLRVSARTLEEGRCVVTPSARGGVASLALRRQDYDRSAFRSVRWNTDKVCADIAALLGSRLDEDDCILDINDLSDLLEYATTPEKYSPVVAFIRLLITPFGLAVEPYDDFASQGQQTAFGRRGPPFSA